MAVPRIRRIMELAIAGLNGKFGSAIFAIKNDKQIMPKYYNL